MDTTAEPVLRGEWFAAGGSDAVPATLRRTGADWELGGEAPHALHDADSTRISPRLGRLPRRFRFPDGSLFVTQDNDTVDQLLSDASGGRVGTSLVHLAESRWRWALAALVCVPLVLWLLFAFGLPAAAKPLANAVPATMKRQLDASLLELLDDQWLEPSEIAPELHDQARSLARDLPDSAAIDVQFRSGGPLGANALALPGGTVIVTDELLALVEHDGELLAVLAHEAGHVHGNHALRNIIQAAGVSFTMGWLVGDLSLVTDFALVTVPTVLQQLQYSRDFEREADAWASRQLESAGESPACLGSLLAKLVKESGGAERAIPEYLLSHPATETRIAATQSARPCGD